MRSKPATTTRWKQELKKVPGLVQLAHLFRYAANPGYRSEQRLLQEQPHRLFQHYGHTAHDRYPRIFAFVRERLGSVAAPRLLSFGCSTGEEVFTLRHYFPQADITGIDINPRSIAICRTRQAECTDERMRFELANSPDGEPDAHYDAVFCMGVLRHGGLSNTNMENCAHLIRFADFESIVASLCRCTRPGGYLAIRGSNFRFADTPAARGFDTALSIETGPRADTPLYGPDNRRLPGAAYEDVVFRRKESA